MFKLSLSSRMGDGFGVEQDQRDKDVNTWVHMGGTTTRSRAADQISQKIWSSNVQFGSDIALNFDDQGRLHLGIMAGIGYAHTKSRTDYQSCSSSSKLDGYSVGLYGTWFGKGYAENSGPYVDVWLQHGWFDNTIKGNYIAHESYKSRVLSASVEGGWTFKVYDRNQMNVMIQPQAQLIYSRFDADALIEQNGTRVRNPKKSGLTSRLGVRVYSEIKTGKDRTWKPYFELNWLHDTAQGRVTMNNDSFELNVPKSRVDARIGVQGQLNKSWSIWGYV